MTYGGILDCSVRQAGSAVVMDDLKPNNSETRGVFQTRSERRPVSGCHSEENLKPQGLRAFAVAVVHHRHVLRTREKRVGWLIDEINCQQLYCQSKFTLAAPRSRSIPA
jgi:hypothetical protein